jgi:hypothetical protein
MSPGRPAGAAKNFAARHDAPPSLVSSSLPGTPYALSFW